MLEKATCGVIVVKSEIPLSWLFKSLTPFLYICMISKHFNDYECLLILLPLLKIVARSWCRLIGYETWHIKQYRLSTRKKRVSVFKCTNFLNLTCIIFPNEVVELNFTCTCVVMSWIFSLRLMWWVMVK